MSAKGVIVEFDFAAMDGALVQFQTAKAFFEKLDHLAFDAGIEARFFAGKTYAEAIAAYFAFVKTKKTVPKAVREFPEALLKGLDAAMPSAITPGLRNFVKALTDKGLRVVLSTRTHLSDKTVAAAFAEVLSDNVVLYTEESQVYGSLTAESWRHACVANKLNPYSLVIVTGSGLGVKSCLRAGFPAVGVMSDHVAYQDFSGADAVVDALNGPTAKQILDMMRIK